jgi:hypothetical protein
MMRQNRPIARAGAAIIATLIGWGLMRLLVPAFDYFPPDSLTRDLEPSWFIAAGARKAAGLGYLTVALVLMAVFFNAVQQRWPGRRGVKGLAFGASLGVVWSFGGSSSRRWRAALDALCSLTASPLIHAATPTPRFREARCAYSLAPVALGHAASSPAPGICSRDN